MKRILIVGGGASGLAAAITAAQQGAKVTVLERLPRVGKKILATGNGRCNLGHTGCDFSKYHGTVPQAKSILQRFDTQAFFASLGILTRTDAEGRMYPAANAASSVLDSLRLACARYNVTEICDTKLTALKQKGDTWVALCGEKAYTADAVILAAGGAAAPNCGTDGNLLPMLQAMGHAVTHPLPALCPIPTDPALVRSLKGMRVQASASLLLQDTVCKTEIGEVQFTENALSGICIFNLSRLAAIHGNRARIALDLLPHHSMEEADALIQQWITLRAEDDAESLLIGLLPKRVSAVCIRQAMKKNQGTVKSIFPDTMARKTLLQLLKCWVFPVTGTATFAQAQVTAGGVSGQSITGTLESRLAKNLYLCGELLDIDGDCGGYNLDWAWASGCCAGKAATKG
ncbi:MAG: aminoacetone oxidase family FAD-binding enzyme [Oscillospiraceae bacterium]|nr:aminoacetone oxidase family FAD-binding enzyme [Oscillospiraceae bacterium]